MTAFEKAASEQGAAHAADGPSTEAPATVDADGVPRLPLDDAIKLLVRAVQEVISIHLPYISPLSPLYLPQVRAVQEVEATEDFELRLAFQTALASESGHQMKAAKEGGPAKAGVLSHTRFTEMVLKIDPSKKAREIDAYFFEALELSDSHEYTHGTDGGGMTPVTDAIDEEAWLSIANLHGLRLKVIQHVRPRRRSSAGYQRG